MSKGKSKISSCSLFFHETILNDKDLIPVDVFLFGLIAFRSNHEKGCFATNKSLAEFLHCSPSTVSTSVQHLVRKGYIVESRADETNGGRNYIRKVREDLKKPPSVDKKMELSITESDRLTSEKPIHKYKVEDKREKEIKFDIIKVGGVNIFKTEKEEKKYVRTRLERGIDAKLYDDLKNLYQDRIRINWDVQSTDELINICCLFYRSFIRDRKYIKNKVGFFKDVFEAMITTKIDFLKNLHLSTIINCWNFILSNKIVERKCHKFLRFYKMKLSEGDEGYEKDYKKIREITDDDYAY